MTVTEKHELMNGELYLTLNLGSAVSPFVNKARLNRQDQSCRCCTPGIIEGGGMGYRPHPGFEWLPFLKQQLGTFSTRKHLSTDTTCVPMNCLPYVEVLTRSASSADLSPVEHVGSAGTYTPTQC